MPRAFVEEGRDFKAAPPTDEEIADVLMDPVEALGLPGTLGDRPQIEKELDLVSACIRRFYRLQPDQVMRECSAFSARLTEMQVLLHRQENLGGRQYTRIRTQQVERFLSELERQWKTASRLIEVSRQDIELMR